MKNEKEWVNKYIFLVFSEVGRILISHSHFHFAVCSEKMQKVSSWVLMQETSLGNISNEFPKWVLGCNLICRKLEKESKSFSLCMFT